MSKQTPRSLLKSTGLVSAMTLLSRILGLVRDIVFAVLFGAGSGMDAFFVAFKIPNFFRRLFAEGAFAQAFVPVLANYQHHKSQLEVRVLIASASGTLGVLLLGLMLLGIVFAPAWIWVFAPGFHQLPEKMALASQLLQRTFPYLPCIALVALSGSVLNTQKHFFAPAIAPVLLNLILITVAVGFVQYFDQPVMALGWGVMIAGVVQLLFQLPFLAHYQLLVWPKWQWSHPGVKQVRTLMLPAIFGVSVSQINLLLDTVLASFLVDGSVSWLYFADRIMELPLGIFGIAIATVILPKLSQDHLSDSVSAFSKTLDWGLQWVIVLGLPAAAAMIVLAEPIMATLFYRGAFELTDVMQSAAALRAYAVGVLAFMLVKVLAPGFFARQDTKTPVRIAVKAVVANMVFSLLLIKPLAHVGLAYATAFAAIVNALLLGIALVRQNIYRPQFVWSVFLAKVILSCCLMLVALRVLFPQTPVWLEKNLWLNVGLMTRWILVGVGVYLGVLWAFGVHKQLLGQQLGNK